MTDGPTVRETHGEPSAEDFFLEHVHANRPLVLRGGVKGWRALGWSADYLREWDDEAIAVAPLQVHGPHAFCDKWLEEPSLWNHVEPEPAIVNGRNLLVVNAARVQMPIHRFRSLLLPESSGAAAAFYADGAGNLARSFPFLASDFAPPPMASLLELKRADLWIGGRSTSRMHFDNLDNVFAQLVGQKTFVLAPPDEGASLVQGRLRKAARAYDHPGLFSRQRGRVTDETVINYLSVNRPPSMATVSVTLDAGDMLYLPFGWWHEVHGEGDANRGGMCASVSHFYHPYHCRLGGPTTTELGAMLVNPKYREVSERLGVGDTGAHG
mmetsp:Transcript_59317/g.176173  ORF Transcript_59317/g.176173 Transcript_59317/m.176173 type:complete len:325 (+) Transcript_59317:26-1000(+)